MVMRAVASHDQDAVTFLMDEHAAVEMLFVEYQTLADGGDRARRRDVVDRIIGDLRIHAAMEEQSFYPSVREVLADGNALVDEGLEEHAEAKELLAELASMPVEDPAFDPKVQTLISEVRHHVNEEETEVLPKLRQAVGESWLVELGAELVRTKERLQGQGVAEAAAPMVEPAPPVLTSAGPASARRRPAGRIAKRTTKTAPKPATKTGAKRASKGAAKASSRSAPGARSTAKSPSRAPSTSPANKRASRVTYHVKPSRDGRWQVAKRGAARPSSTHDRKSDAVARGRELARKQRLGQLVVHAADGKIQSESTYGADPRRSRG